MNLNILPCLCVIVLLMPTGLHGIKANLQAIPNVVRRGLFTVLKCSYSDLQGSPIYAVKWYRGIREFYSYIPNDIPQQKEFPVPGIHVDNSNSNSTQVTLRNMDFDSSGNYTCEVSVDAPTFGTSSYTVNVDVVDLPKGLPDITTDLKTVRPGDILHVNCTSPPSRPAVNLTMLINNQLMSGAKKFYYDTEEGYQQSHLVVEEMVTNSHFLNSKVIIKCVAQYRPIYSQLAIKSLWQSSDPKPERITSADSGTSIVSSNTFFILFIIYIAFIQMGISADYGNFYSLTDGLSSEDYYDEQIQELPQNIAKSIL